MTIFIICPYCEKPAKLVDSSLVYSQSYGKIWYCKSCDAWVGTHKNSKKHKPLGRLANKELRQWKIKAHAFFDLLVQGKIRRDKCSKNQARKAAYKWLARQLGIETKDCHIGMFDIDMCKKVIQICQIGNNTDSD
jgi:hypothetical protein